MAYPILTAPPGVSGAAKPGAAATVYQFTVPRQVKYRVQADIVSGSAPLTMEIHLFTYPASSFTVTSGAIVATFPAGTHYAAVRSSSGAISDQRYKIWSRPTANTPTAPVGSQSNPILLVPGHLRDTRTFSKTRHVYWYNYTPPAAGVHQFRATPAPMPGVEVYNMTIFDATDTVVAATPKGVITKAVTPQKYTIVLGIPSQYLTTSRQVTMAVG
jgi:hypothetical protein